MICYACRAKIENGRAKCPICGFPVIQSVEGNEAEFARIRQMADDYRKRWLGGVVIGIATYSYIVDGHKLKQDKIEDLDLARAEDLTIGQTVWSDVDFAGVDDQGMVTVNAFMKKNGIRYAYELQARLPAVSGVCRVGVVLVEGLKAQLVFGNETSRTFSQMFSLIVAGE